MSANDDRVTQHLQELGKDDSSAAAQLLPIVYDELHALAEAAFRREPHGHTLQPTALVHEVYLRLTRERSDHCDNRERFFAIAALAMQRVLRDHARRRRAAKRGGSWARLTLSDVAGLQMDEQREIDLLDLDEALVELGRIDDRKARVVTLRFFGGLTNEATARQLGVSRSTVVKDWTFARAWLGTQLRKKAR